MKPLNYISQHFHPSTTLNGGQVGDPVQLINVTKTEYMYRYNGKEWQDELGLDVYDFHARNYMPDIGRTTTTLDPLADNFANQSAKGSKVVVVLPISGI